LYSKNIENKLVMSLSSSIIIIFALDLDVRPHSILIINIIYYG
jgi:hypothetical protein